MIFKQTRIVLGLLVLLGSCKEEKVDFSTSVKPIINKRCISCHGGVKKNGGFSLLFREEALAATESGKHGIVPGDPSASEMIRRLSLHDAEQRMPYKEEPLTSEEITTLTKWVEQGAEWSDHWAYMPLRPVSVPVPEQKLASFDNGGSDWPSNEIDQFIAQRLTEEGLEHSPQADRHTLVRRLSLDLTGIPPGPAQAENFIKDEDPEAYGKLVDSLLASPHYGEKWASWWLDLARYSDTKGYERDVTRTIWRYRDWVIKAFNSDKPFDHFTIEQLAGDMLPGCTDDQLIATAFHRNTMNNDEGGTEDEEFRVASVIDRVSTTWEVWQSTTMACVQCHSHPYDPFRHEDFYRSYAYFNNTRDEDTEGEHPNLRTYQEADQKKLDEIIRWVSNIDATRTSEVQRFLKTLEPKYHPHAFDKFVNGELIDTKWLGIRPGGSARLKEISLAGKDNLIINYWASEEGGSFEIHLDDVSGKVIATVALPKTGWERKTIQIPLKKESGVHDLYFTFKNTRIKPDQPVCGIEWFAFRAMLPEEGTPAFSSMQRNFLALLNAKVENTPVMIENTSEQFRRTFVFERGNWLVPSAAIEAGIPASIRPQENKYSPNRLGFAQWLVSPENPLTARTIVNRVWEQIFGAGLVVTLEDFGSQGAKPTHPELLDWLSYRFMYVHRWSVKKLIRDIVMSSTYRQSSVISQTSLEKDPSNQFLSRMPRVRLSAEQVRDQALAVSGLLSTKMYGKSVMPYQPEGIWQSVWNGEYWKQSEAEDQYRRGVYTFIKRTSPYPSMLIFDGSSREVCQSRRIPTNTPLQALVTMNDPVFVQSAAAFAKWMNKDSAPVDEKLRRGYKRITFHEPEAPKLNALKKLYNDAFAHYSQDTTGLKKLTSATAPTPDLGAMTMVANALLNLDEVIMKE
jgi:hypothetical protein